MRQIADYVASEGAITIKELNEVDTDLWRKAVTNFKIPSLTQEMEVLSRFILRAA